MLIQDVSEKSIDQIGEELQKEIGETERQLIDLRKALEGIDALKRLMSTEVSIANVSPTRNRQGYEGMSISVETVERQPRARSGTSRQFIIQALRQANGRPMHVKELWTAMKNLGATTSSERPENVVVALISRIEEPRIQKTGPSTWRWVDDAGSGKSEGGEAV